MHECQCVTYNIKYQTKMFYILYISVLKHKLTFQAKPFIKMFGTKLDSLKLR